MIEIKNENGRFLELEPDTTLEQELNSWLIPEGDVLPASYSFPFRFYLSPSNQVFIGHKHRFEASNFVGWPVEVSIDGLPWGPATLNFRIKDEYADAYLIFDGGTVASQLQTKTLADVFQYDSFQMCASAADLPAAMALTLNTKTSPWPFVFFPVYNADFTDQKQQSTEEDSTDGFRYNPIVNEYRGSGFVGDYRSENINDLQTVTTYGNGVVPYFFLWWVIDKVCAYLGYSAAGTWLQDPGMRSLVMYNNVSLSLTFGVQVWPKYHVWSMKLNEFFQLLRTDLGVGVFFDARQEKVIFHTFVRIAAQTPTLDLSDQRLTGHTIDPVRQGGYTIQFPTVGDSKEDTSTAAPYVISRGDTAVSMKLSTLPMAIKKRRYSLIIQINMLVPEAKERGQSLDILYNNIKQYSLDLPNNPPRILAYLGMQPDQLNHLYPMGSSLSRNINQVTVGRISTHPDEPDSIFHQWVRPYWEFKAFSKPITQRFRLKIGQARSARLWEPVLTQSPELLKLPCLIQKIVTKWPAQEGMLTTQTTLWPLIVPPDYTPVIPIGIWVKVKMNLWTAFTSPQARAYNVILQFFFDAAGTMPALVKNNLTFHYSYQTIGYESETGSTKVETVNKAVRLTAPAVELEAEYLHTIWINDSAALQKDHPDEFYTLPNSFRVTPGAGYRIA